jgi:hypothetical protein
VYVVFEEESVVRAMGIEKGGISNGEGEGGLLDE